MWGGGHFPVSWQDEMKGSVAHPFTDHTFPFFCSFLTSFKAENRTSPIWITNSLETAIDDRIQEPATES